MIRQSDHWWLVLFLGLTLIFATCRGGRQNSDNSKASEVTIYVSQDRVFSEPILRAYEQKTGVKVNGVYDTEETKSTGLANRLLAEKNHPQADVFWSNEPVRTLVLKKRGVLAPYKSPSAVGIPDVFKDAEGYWTGFSARSRVIVYNMKLVKPEEAPKSVLDLTDTDDVNVALEDKQPVAMVFPDRDGMGVPVMPNMVSLIAGAPHAEAGKKLIDYLVSPEVERMLSQSEAVQIPLHSGIEGPKNMPSISSLKPMTLDYGKAADRVEDVTRRLQTILGL